MLWCTAHSMSWKVSLFKFLILLHLLLLPFSFNKLVTVVAVSSDMGTVNIFVFHKIRVCLHPDFNNHALRKFFREYLYAYVQGPCWMELSYFEFPVILNSNQWDCFFSYLLPIFDHFKFSYRKVPAISNRFLFPLA